MQKYKIYAIIYILFSQLFNVYLIQLIFSDDGNISSFSLKFFLWFCGITLLLIGVLKFYNRCRFKAVYDNIVFLGFILLLTIYIAIVGDKFVGSYILKTGIVFEPNTSVYYKTSEYYFVATINSIGIRDKEYSIEKKNIYRILTIGDSFTYGWGNSIDNVWSTILENDLIKKGYHIEILNLGKPGASPADYTTIACKAIPILKPDLVIIGLLQGDDIMQMVEISNQPHTTIKPNNTEFDYHALIDFDFIIQKYFLNYNRLIHHTKSIEIGNNWKANSNHIYNGLTTNEKKVFNTLSIPVKKAFFNGDLYPWVVISSIKNPDYFVNANDSSRTEIKQAILKIKQEFNSIKEVAKQFKSKILLASIPAKPFVCRRCMHTDELLAYTNSPNLIDSNAVDCMAKKIAYDLGFDFFKCTNDYKFVADSIFLFYKYDGHLNSKGNSLFAKSIEKEIINKYKEDIVK